MTLQIIILVLSCTLVTAVLGFLGGIVFEKWWTAGALERATRKVNKAVEQLLKSLETTHKVAGKVAGFPGKQMDQKQALEVNKLQQQLNTSLDALLGVYLNPVQQEVIAESKPVIIPPPQWVMTPRDFRSELPDYAAAMQNLNYHAEHVRQQGNGAILLIQLDRFDDLGKRYGEQERCSLLKNLSNLIVRNMREADVLCHLHDDLLLLIMPWIVDEQIALSIRDTIKGHRFYLEKNREEVFVTSSMGLYVLSAGDSAQLSLERATAALVESRKKGRNQLMQHNGRMTLACRAS